MIIYQVKITVNQDIIPVWLNWMKTIHIPDVIATGLVSSYQLKQSQQNESVFVFHYQFNSQEDYDEYSKKYAPKLKNHPKEKFPNQFIAEREVFISI